MNAVRFDQRVLGCGATGTVYAAYDPHTGRPLAIKVIPLAGTWEQQARAVAAAEALRALVHPHVVRVRAVRRCPAEASLELVMERVGGGSVGALLEDAGALAEGAAQRYTRGVLAGLEFLHGRGVVHRDVKPHNILLTEAGEAKLADLGAAAQGRESGTGNTLVGTPWYMAPEALDGGGAQPSVDVWSVGVTVFEMATGRRPFGASSPSAVAVLYAIDRAAEEERGTSGGGGGGSVAVPWPASASVSAALVNFVAQCLVSDLARRPTCAQLLRHPWILGGEGEGGGGSGEDDDDDDEDDMTPRPLFDAADVPMAPAAKASSLADQRRQRLSCFGTKSN